MARNRKNRTAVYPEPWNTRASVQDAHHFALRQAGKWIEEFTAAADRRDDAKMINAVRHIRGVGQKLDAFRRMKIREWNAAEAAKTQTQGGNT